MQLITQGKTNVPYLLIVIAIAIIAGGFILGYYYFWMIEIEARLAEVEQRLPEGVTKEKTQISNEKSQSPCDEVEAKRGCVVYGFNIISPNGGETLCIGETHNIHWKVPPDVDTVTITLRSGGVLSTQSVIGTFPASFNETGEQTGEGIIPWTVPVPPGHDYEMWINAAYKGSSVNDVSDGIFSIIGCEG